MVTEESVRVGVRLALVEMIKSGTTAFAESGSTHMGDVAEAVKESGMRAAIARSTMDIGGAIPDSMKISAEKNMQLTQDLYEKYQGQGRGGWISGCHPPGDDLFAGTDPGGMGE